MDDPPGARPRLERLARAIKEDLTVATDRVIRGGFRTLPRRALMHVGLGRRLWWRGRKRNEVDFWAGWLTGAPGTEQWADDREERLNPETEIRDPVVRAELEQNPADEISILDVGAGPLTWLGYRYPGKRLRLVPIDPLAADYDHLLSKAGLDPPVRTIPVAGEELLEHFDPASFDIAYATNALDHSADPLTIISNMVTVVRPGGAVILRHKRNEGASARYSGLHAWNFDTADGRLLLWNEATEVDVGAVLAGRARTTAWREDNEVVARLAVREASELRRP
jgi:SAM-dependent methyltransferase